MLFGRAAAVGLRLRRSVANEVAVVEAVGFLFVFALAAVSRESVQQAQIVAHLMCQRAAHVVVAGAARAKGVVLDHDAVGQRVGASPDPGPESVSAY